jgi:hypothetical protein
MTDQFEPSLGYNDTSGHQAAESSAEGVRHADVTGITAKAQKYALIMATQGGRNGVTVAELRERHGSLHHGRISAALTNLHKAGRLAALRERRGHCGIYVLPEFVEGREVREFRSNRPHLDVLELTNEIGRHSLLLSLRHDGRSCTCGLPLQPGVSFHRHLAEAIVEEFGR